MITLTDPCLIKTILGSDTTVGYDKAVVVPTIDPIKGTVSCYVHVTVSSDPTQQDIKGSIVANVGASRVDVTFGQLGIARSVTLNAAQKTAISNLITNTQDTIEAGLISLGLIDGIQSAGS